ncbi:hypothetical protein GS421_07145 [Rhodococcus hoagii]|nr:hypothetical protein [Prescottella equi]
MQEVLPQWAPLAAAPQALYIGGPVTRDAALCLATVRAGVDVSGVPGLRRIDGRVGWGPRRRPRTDRRGDRRAARLAGYAGWTIGQLDAEIDNDDWIVLSALASDVISPPRVDVWGQVLRRQPMPLALLATHPSTST